MCKISVNTCSSYVVDSSSTVQYRIILAPPPAEKAPVSSSPSEMRDCRRVHPFQAFRIDMSPRSNAADVLGLYPRFPLHVPSESAVEDLRRPMPQPAPRTLSAAAGAPIAEDLCEECSDGLVTSISRPFVPVQPSSSASGTVSDDELQAAYETILRAIGEDPSREGLRKTPARAAKAMRALTAGYAVAPANLARDALFALEPNGDQPHGMVVVVSSVPARARVSSGVPLASLASRASPASPDSPASLAFVGRPTDVLLSGIVLFIHAARYPDKLSVRASLAAVFRTVPCGLSAKGRCPWPVEARARGGRMRAPAADAGAVDAADCRCHL